MADMRDGRNRRRRVGMICQFDECAEWRSQLQRAESPALPRLIVPMAGSRSEIRCVFTFI